MGTIREAVFPSLFLRKRNYRLILMGIGTVGIEFKILLVIN